MIFVYKAANLKHRVKGVNALWIYWCLLLSKYAFHCTSSIVFNTIQINGIFPPSKCSRDQD